MWFSAAFGPWFGRGRQHVNKSTDDCSIRIPNQMLKVTPIQSLMVVSPFWLVVSLWKIWKSVGIIIPNIWANKIHVANHQPVEYHHCVGEGAKKGTARGRIQVAFTTQLCPSAVMPAHVQCCIFGAKATSNFHSLLSGCSPMFISWLNHVDSPCNRWILRNVYVLFSVV